MNTLLLGIFLAATLFGGLLWCGFQAYMSTGRRRLVFLCTALLTILVMALITYQLELLGRAFGALLALSALGATYFDRGWARLLPLTLAALGAFAALGAPFG